MTKFLKERLPRDLRKLKEQREDARRRQPEDEAERRGYNMLTSRRG
jgi:hypothetical protein